MYLSSSDLADQVDRFLAAIPKSTLHDVARPIPDLLGRVLYAHGIDDVEASVTTADDALQEFRGFALWSHIEAPDDEIDGSVVVVSRDRKLTWIDLHGRRRAAVLEFEVSSKPTTSDELIRLCGGAPLVWGHSLMVHQFSHIAKAARNRAARMDRLLELVESAEKLDAGTWATHELVVSAASSEDEGAELCVRDVVKHEARELYLMRERFEGAAPHLVQAYEDVADAIAAANARYGDLRRKEDDGELAAPRLVDQPPPAPEDARALERVIQDARHDFPAMAPRMQSMKLTEWAAGVRNLSARNPERDAGGTARIWTRLTELSRCYRPGWISALRGEATVEEVAAEHGFASSESWAKIASQAAEHAERLRFDDQGWGDREQLEPGSKDPDAELERAELAIREVLGDLRHEASEATVRGRIGTLGTSDWSALRRAGRRLRWIRGSVLDNRRWGQLIALLRRADHASAEHPLEAVLDPEVAPSRGWAAALAESDRADEVASAGAELATMFEEALLVQDWTRASKTAWEVINMSGLPHTCLAPVFERHRDQAAFVLGDERLDECADCRRARRRLMQLRSLALPPVVHSSPLETGVPEHRPSPINGFRSFLDGKRVLFVSNDTRQRVRDALERDGGCEIDWIEADKLRKVESKADAVAGGRFDLVLVATGFISHKADSLLRPACKDASIPCLDVGAGTVRAVATALATHLDLLDD